MFTPELISYIQQQSALGKTPQQIKSELMLAGGWLASDIDEALVSLNSGVSQKPHSKNKVVLIFIVFLLLCGGIFAAKKYDILTPANTMPQETPTVIDDATMDTEENQSQIKDSTIPANITVADNEIQILSQPDPKNVYYLGNPISFVVAGGKSIDSLVLEFPPAGAEIVVSRKNTSDYFIFTYTPPKTSESIGDVIFHVVPITQIPGAKTISIPVYIDIDEIPKNITISYEQNDVLTLSKSEIQSVSSTAPVPGSVPLSITAAYSSGTYEVIPPQSSVSVQNTAVLTIASEAISKYAPNQKFTVLRPNMKGSTRLTVKYKNISKTIDVVVVD